MLNANCIGHRNQIQECIHTNAFNYNWSKNDTCYAFPPFNMVGKVVRKMIKDDVENLLLVAPDWPSLHWYPLILEHRCPKSVILKLKNRSTLLRLPYDTSKQHGIWNKFILFQALLKMLNACNLPVNAQEIIMASITTSTKGRVANIFLEKNLDC